MGILIGLVIVLFSIIAIIDALRGPLSVEKKILWVVLIIVVPLIGIILYFLLGKTTAE